MADQTPVDVDAIRARLDATSPGMTVDVHAGGSTLRATGNAADRPGFVGAVTGLVGAVVGETGPLQLTFADDEDGQDATFALHAAADLRRLLDEVERLNAEFADFREMAVINTRSQSRAVIEARAELDRVIREGAADKALIAEFATLQDRIPDTDNGDWGLGYDQGYNAALNDVRSMAAPEMPRPPTEEAQERPETPGAGWGRGTGVAEASGTAQAVEEWGVRRRDGRVLSFEDRDDAEAFADGWQGGERTVVHRFIGPWEPAPSLPVPSTADYRHEPEGLSALRSNEKGTTDAE